MGKVWTGATMSLDGYISGPEESGFDHLFRWYESGDVEFPTTHDDLTFHLTAQSAAYVREMLDATGVFVVGRRLFDVTNGWGGRHPYDLPVVVLTHSVPEGWPREDAPFTFVTEGGIERAIAVAQEIAGDKVVGVNGGQMARQALEAGLLDEIWVDLAPVLLGGGRPFFDAVAGAPHALEGPISIVPGEQVTHLRYRVVR